MPVGEWATNGRRKLVYDTGSVASAYQRPRQQGIKPLTKQRFIASWQFAAGVLTTLLALAIIMIAASLLAD